MAMPIDRDVGDIEGNNRRAGKNIVIEVANMIGTLQTRMIAAFTARTISFLSPCVLPLVPVYVSYIAGESIAERSVPIAAMLRLIRDLGAAALMNCRVFCKR
jgi:cytochrome c biogenesis protein CcdA